MKPIYECCDIMLRQLEVNYGEKEIPDLDVTGLLNQFDVPSGRHEFFKGILNILIDDGYADFLDYVIDRKQLKLDVYKNRVLITPKGFQLLKDKGYTKMASDKKAFEKIRSSRERRLSNGTVYLAILTGGLVLTEVLIHWEYLKALFSCH